MDGFVRVGKTDEFPRGKGRMVKVEGVDVAVFRVGEKWYAMKDACPHMGASLAGGRIDGGKIECHWHGWRFDLATGESGHRQFCAVVCALRIEGDEVWVEPPPPPKLGGPPPDDEPWVRWDDTFLKKRDD